MNPEYTVSQVCRNLQISRQAVYQNTKGQRRRFYQRAGDAELVPLIQQVIESRATYGYKRVTAMVNRLRREQQMPRVNKKRIYRLMRIHGLLLPKNQITRAPDLKTGKVMTLYSNTRWCSDAFEIRCFNREKVYVVFSLDCRDREVLAFVAKAEPLLAQDIQSLMILSVEKRFNSTRTPRPLEWLSDRGAIYRAKETRQIARYLGLQPCFTAAYSPESNGMAEAFVKTFKRDYVYTHDCSCAQEVLAQLPAWFEDYNNSPHSALAYKSPVEYLQQSTHQAVN
jgi:putative transposase